MKPFAWQRLSPDRRHRANYRFGRGSRPFGLLRDERGSVSLEAALALPFFLAFVLALICLIKLTVADLALQNAVNETVKQIAANGYPVQLLADEAMQAYANSPAGGFVDQWLSRIRSARDTLEQGEQWVDDYRAFIPDLLVRWVDWEQQKRAQAERLAEDEYEKFVHEHIEPLVNAGFKEAVLHYADTNVLDEAQLRVVHVDVPRLHEAGDKFIGIEAEYVVKLPIPFVHKTVKLRKKAYERLWTGA